MQKDSSGSRHNPPRVQVVLDTILGYMIQIQNSNQRSTSRHPETWCDKKTWISNYGCHLVGLQDNQFYACFEESISEYGAQVNQFNIRDNLLHLKGQPTSSNFTHKRVKSTLSENIYISEEYGSEAQVGGTLEYKRTAVQLTLVVKFII